MDNSIQIKISPRLLALVSRAEYLRGQFEQIARSRNLSGPKRLLRVAIEEALVGIEIEPLPGRSEDKVSSANLNLALEPLFEINSHYAAATLLEKSKEASRPGVPLHIAGSVVAQLLDFPSSMDDLLAIHTLVSGEKEETRVRHEPYTLRDSYLGTVFQGVSPSIIETRLKLCLKLASGQLNENLHPLIRGALFHLLFLQTLPFSHSNQRLAFILQKSLLLSLDYRFVRLVVLSEGFSEKSSEYLRALQLAERSSFGTWSGAHFWLELYLETIIDGIEKALAIEQASVPEARLSVTQKRIIEAIISQPGAGRDLLSQKTGIKSSTLKYNLKVLTERGFLTREGKGRATSYRLK